MIEVLLSKRPYLLVFAAVLSLTVGCGDGNKIPRFKVSGSVTLDGEPLDTGSILFGPEAEGVMGGGATIEDGTYSIPSSKGLQEGKYRVRITSADTSGTVEEEEAPGESLQVSPERIPAEYNVRSEEFIEVTADGSNTFDFDIESK